MHAGPYTREFFETELETSYQSAQRIVPLVLALVPARSVLDVGCGTGHFLHVFAEMGVEKIAGLDGAYVPSDKLMIDARHFSSCDLAVGFELHQRFDLVVSLEVAEHLPPTSADLFVDSLVRHADVVLFSAAIPHQGGTGHLNEQWPSYWADHFKCRGYLAYDAIRPAIWADEQVAWWYRQNTLLFAKEEVCRAFPALAGLTPVDGPSLDHIHPMAYDRQVKAMLAASEELAELRSKRRWGKVSKIRSSLFR